MVWDARSIPEVATFQSANLRPKICFQTVVGHLLWLILWMKQINDKQQGIYNIDSYLGWFEMPSKSIGGKYRLGIASSFIRRLRVLTTVMTFPKALRYNRYQKPSWEGSNLEKIHLNATITESALWAFTPNTFLKNNAATVTPEFWISCGVAALHGKWWMGYQRSGKTKQKTTTYAK